MMNNTFNTNPYFMKVMKNSVFGKSAIYDINSIYPKFPKVPVKSNVDFSYFKAHVYEIEKDEVVFDVYDLFKPEIKVYKNNPHSCMDVYYDDDIEETPYDAKATLYKKPPENILLTRTPKDDYFVSNKTVHRYRQLNLKYFDTKKNFIIGIFNGTLILITKNMYCINFENLKYIRKHLPDMFVKIAVSVIKNRKTRGVSKFLYNYIKRNLRPEEKLYIKLTKGLNI